MPDAKPMAKTARRSTTSRRTEAKIGNPRIVRSRILRPTGTHGSGNWQELRDDALSREAGETTQLQTERMGELLPSRAGLQGLPGGRCPYQPSAAPVVMQEASGQRKGDHSLPRPVPLRNPEAGPIAGADAQPAVGEGMSACP